MRERERGQTKKPQFKDMKVDGWRFIKLFEDDSRQEMKVREVYSKSRISEEENIIRELPVTSN